VSLIHIRVLFISCDCTGSISAYKRGLTIDHCYADTFKGKRLNYSFPNYMGIPLSSIFVS